MIPAIKECWIYTFFQCKHRKISLLIYGAHCANLLNSGHLSCHVSPYIQSGHLVFFLTEPYLLHEFSPNSSKFTSWLGSSLSYCILTVLDTGFFLITCTQNREPFIDTNILSFSTLLTPISAGSGINIYQLNFCRYIMFFVVPPIV